MRSKIICALAASLMIASIGTTSASAATEVEVIAEQQGIVSVETQSNTIAEWEKGTKYFVGDKVIYDNKIYECKVDHRRTSPTMAYVWKLIGEVKVPQWKSNTKYIVGDRVMYEGKTYECIVDHSKLSPLTKYVWKLIVE